MGRSQDYSSKEDWCPMAQLIDGKAISAQIKEEVKEKVAALKEQGREVTVYFILKRNNIISISTIFFYFSY